MTWDVYNLRVRTSRGHYGIVKEAHLTLSVCSDGGEKVSRRNLCLNCYLCVSLFQGLLPCDHLMTARPLGAKCCLVLLPVRSPTALFPNSLINSHACFCTVDKGMEYDDWLVSPHGGRIQGSVRKGKWVNSKTILIKHLICLRHCSISFICIIFLNPLRTL